MIEDKKIDSEKTGQKTEPGFFKKLFTKLDDKIQAKAKESSGSCCCSDADKKSGKCS